MAWDETLTWLAGSTHEKLYQDLLDDAAARPTRIAFRKKIVHPDEMPWEMSRQGLREIGHEDLDIVFLENVGNLVCPAEFAVGEDEKAVILSITEGDDKPMKYPLIFKESAVAVLNKIDLLPYTNFNLPSAREDISTLHPGIDIIEASCMTKKGIDEWCNWLKTRIEKKKK